MCAVPDHVEMSKKAIRDHAMAFSKRWADATSEAADPTSMTAGPSTIHL
jgi:hypothetical protein